MKKQTSIPLQLRTPLGCLTLRAVLLGSAILSYLAVAVTARAADSTDTFYGNLAGYNCTTCEHSSAFGDGGLFFSNSNDNTAVGFNALIQDTTGFDNTAVGSEALLNSTSGNANTALGRQALYGGVDQNGFPNSTGSYNVANGWQALYSNTSGTYNTALGSSALYSNVFGDGNTAIGESALAHNTGYSNIAIGQAAGYNLTTGIANIDIGNQGVAGESGKIRIGAKGSQTATFIAGIFGKTVKSGTAVFINGNGQLGTVQSSARFKDDIKPMDAASQAILKLHPVTFHYKEELDPDKTPQFGLVAEEVEKVDPDLVVRDDEGKAMTVRYDAVNAMLLNEFLKSRRQIAQQQKQIESLTAAVQKISLRVELGKAAARAVAAEQ